VKDFLRELDTRQLLEGSEIPALNPEVEARTLCIETLKKFCKAYQTGNNELAWKYLEDAKKAYELVCECRTFWKRAMGDVWRAWLLMEGPRKRRLSQDPIFKQIVRLDGMDMEEILDTVMRLEQSRRRLLAPPLTKRMTLKQRGFQCVVEAAPSITASKLIDMVEAGNGATARAYDYDDRDIRLYLDDNDKLVIEDLKSRKKATPITTKPTDQIRIGLKAARDRIT